MTITCATRTGTAIDARGLRKLYGSAVAVDGVDFRVNRGEAFGFLGPNGAGKSSIMRMLAAVGAPSAGALRVLGMDPRIDGPMIRSRLGVVPQEDTLDVELSVRENLFVYGRYFDIPRKVLRERTAELLEFTQLTGRAEDRVSALSGGMRRRLTVARALINRPEIILLDEPTTGLDPQARHAVWHQLHRLKMDGVTLVLTTHYMDEAEQLCDRLVILDRGAIVDEGTPRALIERHCTREVVELRFAATTSRVGIGEIRAAMGRAGIADFDRARMEALPDRLLLYTDRGDHAAAAVRSGGFDPDSLLVRRAGLEDVFLHLTGRELGQP